MNYKNKYSRYEQRHHMLYMYIAFLAILSVSVLLMPFGIRLIGTTNLLTYLSGGMFWIGLVGTISMATFITVSRKRSKNFAQLYPDTKILGLTHFFRNFTALIFDILLIVSLIGFAISRIFIETTWVPFIFLSFLIFSFGMHCMLNGSNYIYIKYKTRSVTES